MIARHEPFKYDCGCERNAYGVTRHCVFHRVQAVCSCSPDRPGHDSDCVFADAAVKGMEHVMEHEVGMICGRGVRGRGVGR